MKLTPSERKEVLSRLDLREGFRVRTYLDGKGVPTIGKGLNLNRPDAQALLRSVGVDVDPWDLSLLRITEYQADLVVERLVDQAEAEAASLPYASGIPRDAFMVLVDLCYNMGKARLLTFTWFGRAMSARDYGQAAMELLLRKPPSPEKSGYWGDVKDRAVANAAILAGLGRIRIAPQTASHALMAICSACGHHREYLIKQPIHSCPKCGGQTYSVTSTVRP